MVSKPGPRELELRRQREARFAAKPPKVPIDRLRKKIAQAPNALETATGAPDKTPAHKRRKKPKRRKAAAPAKDTTA